MIRSLIRLILIVVVVVALGAFFFGYQWGRPDTGEPARPVVGTSGSGDVGAARERARDIGADVGEKVAVGADKAQRAISEGSLTAKIKAKMTLDDTIKARGIDVDTNGTTVTLTGIVSSAAERTRAVQLARETEGVTSVVDNLQVRRIED
jgi:hyperosmotically inducible protein